MKKLFSLLLGLALLPGCAWFSKDTPADQKIAKVNTLAKGVAYNAAKTVLKLDPGARASLEQSYRIVDDTIKRGGINGIWLRDFVDELKRNIKELRSDTAEIILDNGVFLYDLTVGGDKLSLEAQPYAQAAANGIHDGLKQALNL